MLPRVGDGYVWTFDPSTGEVTGQIRVERTTPQNDEGNTTYRGTTGIDAPDPGSWPQDVVDAHFMLIMADLAGSPQELVDPTTGTVAGRASQTLYGTRTWHGEAISPLLYAGQYMDAESGWAYNRFRYYNPHAGIYNAQDPLGVAPRLASAQGYVDHAAIWIDLFGLKDSCPPRIINKKYAGKVYELPKKFRDKYADKLRLSDQGNLGIEFTEEGFPIFDDLVVELPQANSSELRRADVVVEDVVENKAFFDMKRRDQHDAYLDKMFGIDKKYREDNELTWHHHQDLGRMQLIPSDIHKKVRHTGGWRLWGGGSR